MGNGSISRQDKETDTVKSTRFRPVHRIDPDKPDKYAKKGKKYQAFRDLRVASYPVWSVDVNERQKLLAAALADDSVALWDLGTPVPELKVSLVGHSAHVWAVRFSPNGHQLATASSDHTVWIWDTDYRGDATPTPRNVLRGHENGVRCIAFTHGGPNDTYLLSGSMDEHVALWRFDDKVPLRKWRAHEGQVHGIVCSPQDKRTALSIGSDGSVAVWDTFPAPGTDGLLGRFPGSDGFGVLCIDAHPKESGVVAVGAEDGSVWLWFYDDEEGITGHNQLMGHKMSVWSVAFSYNGCLLASGSADRDVRVWDVSDPVMATCVSSISPAHDSFVRQVRFRPKPVPLPHEDFDAESCINLFTKAPKPRKSWDLVTCSVDGLVKTWRSPEHVRLLKRASLESLAVTTEGGEASAKLEPAFSRAANRYRVRIPYGAEAQVWAGATKGGSVSFASFDAARQEVNNYASSEGVQPLSKPHTVTIFVVTADGQGQGKYQVSIEPGEVQGDGGTPTGDLTLAAPVGALQLPPPHPADAGGAAPDTLALPPLPPARAGAAPDTLALPPLPPARAGAAPGAPAGGFADSGPTRSLAGEEVVQDEEVPPPPPTPPGMVM